MQQVNNENIIKLQIAQLINNYCSAITLIKQHAIYNCFTQMSEIYNTLPLQVRDIEDNTDNFIKTGIENINRINLWHGDKNDIEKHIEKTELINNFISLFNNKESSFFKPINLLMLNYLLNFLEKHHSLTGRKTQPFDNEKQNCCIIL